MLKARKAAAAASKRPMKRLEKSEKQRTDRLIGSSRNIFDEQQKLIFKTKEELSTRDKIVKKIKDQNEEFDLTDKIFEQIDNTTKSFSRSLAESLVLGKDIVKSFKELSQRILIDILAKSIERIAFLGLEKALTKTIEILEERKKNKIIQQNAALKQQLAIQSAIAAVSNISSIGGFFSGLFRASGGSVQKGQPTIVGEQGAEMFIPNSSGQITQAARGVGGGAVNVNFNINTVDASGFEELLVRSRGTITQLINNAVNEKGRSSII